MGPPCERRSWGCSSFENPTSCRVSLRIFPGSPIKTHEAWRAASPSPGPHSFLRGDVPSCETFCQEIAEAIEVYEPQFAGMVRGLPSLLAEGPETALHRIAWSGMARPEFDRPIITPFVIPTVLAALWSVLQHLDSWSEAVAGAIRLGGDVDTLGAIVGR